MRKDTTKTNGNSNGNSSSSSSSSSNMSSGPEQTPPVQYSQSTVIRSLRRRLWQAFQREDVAAAMEIYQATVQDWERWVLLEQQQQEETHAAALLLSAAGGGASGRSNGNRWKGQQEQPFRQSSSLFHKLLKKKKPLSTGSGKDIPTTTIALKDDSPLLQSVTTTTAPTSPSSLVSGDADERNVKLLQLYTDPSQPFALDDYKDPYDYASYEHEPVEDVEADAEADKESESNNRPASVRRGRHLKIRMPRQAMGIFGGGHGQQQQQRQRHDAAVGEQQQQIPEGEDAAGQAGGSTSRLDILTDVRMTTPLHEAARCGSGALVRLMLAQQQQQHDTDNNCKLDCHVRADPNVRNGASQTALHMVAGGVTAQEQCRFDERRRRRQQQRFMDAATAAAANNKNDKNDTGQVDDSDSDSSLPLPLGIRRPLPIVEEELRVGGVTNPAGFHAKKAARAVGRFFRQSLSLPHHHKRNNAGAASTTPTTIAADTINGAHAGDVVSDKEWERLCRDRLDAAMAIMSWSHPDDGSGQAGDGPSTNAVDHVGRTALHYAAELGRAGICMELFSYFGTMLTIVDDRSRTPCELASQSHYDDLAAQLEAQALMYLDPYGVDDELLAAVMADETGYLRNVLAPPFAWFETFKMSDVQDERYRRIDQTLKKMRQIADIKEEEEAARAMIFAEVVDGKDKKPIPKDKVMRKSKNSEREQSKEVSESSRSAEGTLEILETAPAQASSEQSEPSSAVKVHSEPSSAANATDENSEPPSAADATDADCVPSVAINVTDSDFEQSLSVNETKDDLEPCPRANATDNECTPSSAVYATGEDSDTLARSNVTDEDLEPPSAAKPSVDEAPPSLASNTGGKEFVPAENSTAQDSERFLVANNLGPDWEPSPLVNANNQDSGPSAGAKTTSETDTECFPSNDDEPRKEGDKSRETLLLVESLHKSHVELYLTYHSWNVREALLEFFLSPVEAFQEAFQEAGVPLPKGSSSALKPTESFASERTCLICCDVFEADSNKWKSLQGCEHSFCKDCLGEYLSDCAQSKTTGLVITCPHHECCTPLSPLEIVTMSPDSDVYGRLLDTANENFVMSAADLRFCPHPGCPGIVKFNFPSYIRAAGVSPDLLSISGAVCTAVHGNAERCPPTYEGVYDPNFFRIASLHQPKRAHRFCFECGDTQVHWPITCKRFDDWRSTVKEEIKEVEDEGGTDYNDVAQRLWLKANTRPCPKCKAPIEKNEGCNHVTCSNPRCKHEFCWICRNDWKLHNTETGGFFRCNRWEDQKDHQYYDETPPPHREASSPQTENVTDPSRMQITYGTAMHETRIAGKRSKEMARFLFHYQRYNAHAESAALERKMSETSCERLAPVVTAAIKFDASPNFNFGGRGLSFVHSAFIELNECRSLLQHSYVFSYFRYKSVHPRKYRLLKRLLKEKFAFEQIQAELEMMTEQMSNVVARSHLRATQAQITYLTASSADKRKEFSYLMINFLYEEVREAKNDCEADDGREQEQSFRDRNRLLLNGGSTHITGLATMAVGADTSLSNRQAAGGDSDDNEVIEQALRASLEEFMANTGSRDVLEIDGDNSDEQGMDWPCAACTYMNNGGLQCAMCGTQR